MNNMRFKFVSNQSPNKDKQYYEWADKLYDNGFNYRLDQLMKDLNVSANWVNTVLYTEVDSVRYTSRYLFKKYEKTNGAFSNHYSTICFNKQQIIDFIKANSTYTRQTKIVDAAKYLNVSDEKFEQYMQEYQEYINTNKEYINKKSSECFYRNVPTQKFNEWLSNTYDKSFYILNCRQRNQYVHEAVEPLNIFDSNYILIVANNHTKNNQEMLYRDMILKGAIKVMLGTKKTFFLVQKENNIKYPYVIPIALPKDDQ